MKMTKTVREFIQEEAKKRIKEKYSAQLEELRAKRDEEEQNYKNAFKLFTEKYTKELNELLRSFNYLALNNAVNFGIPQVSISGCYPRYFPASQAYDTLVKKIDEETNTTTKEIIVSMELGGTKQELMEMLDKLNN